MPSILSPTPRLASHSCQLTTMPYSPLALQSRVQALPFTDSPCTTPRPPRLQSPISLIETIHIPCQPQSPTPSGSTPRRRGKKQSFRPSRLRRYPHHSPRLECPFNSCSATLFDTTPWVSTLEAPLDPSYISDYSNIPITDEISTGPGPVRRRKTSLRSNPLTGSERPTIQDPLRNPRRSHLFPEYPATSPRTPPPHAAFDTNRIIFHHLMPILPTME